MEKIEELRQKVKQNNKEIKLTRCLNILMSCGFITLGIIASTVAPSPLITGIARVLIRWGFPVLGLTATVMSNSWAIEKIKKLKDENSNLKYEIEKEELTQQIKQLEDQRELQKELKQDFKFTKTITANDQRIGNVAAHHEELTR